jgi:hypothetical protein
MKHLIFIVYPALAIALCIFGLGACATTDHGVMLARLPSEVPVSASSLYASNEGLIVSSEEYEVVSHFVLEKTLTGPVGVSSFTSILDVGPEILKLKEKNQADAVVNFRVVPEAYDSGNTGWVGGLRFAGGLYAGLGAFLLVAPSGSSDMLMAKAAGVECLFGGGVLLLGSYIAQWIGKTTWTIAVEGDLVQKK